MLYANNTALLPLIATLFPFSNGTPDESVQTLPLLSMICVAAGTIVPLTEGEAAPLVTPPAEAELLPLEETPPAVVPLDEGLGLDPGLGLLAGSLPDEEELDELLPDEDEPAALTPAPGVQAGRPPTGADAVPFQPPCVGLPYCETYHTNHWQLLVS